MTTYKIAVIGGTGKAGKYLVQHLLEKGYSIKLLLRYPENFIIKNPLIEIVKGDARDYDSIDRLTKDCKAIISTVGQPVGEASVFSNVTKNIIKAMNQNGVKRYIATTGLNVDTPFDKKNERVKMGTEWMYQNYPKTTTDKQVEYEILAECILDWTLVRLPLIIQTSEHFDTEANLEDCVGENISASDLAEFFVSQIEDTKYVRKSPFVYNITK